MNKKSIKSLIEQAEMKQTGDRIDNIVDAVIEHMERVTVNFRLFNATEVTINTDNIAIEDARRHFKIFKNIFYLQQ
jgi:hypothetical protein